MTWWPGWDYLVESAKGWADPYIADAYLLFGSANWFIWSGIGCLVLLLVFEIIDRNARRQKQHGRVASLSKDKLAAASKLRKAGKVRMGR